MEKFLEKLTWTVSSSSEVIILVDGGFGEVFRAHQWNSTSNCMNVMVGDFVKNIRSFERRIAKLVLCISTSLRSTVSRVLFELAKFDLTPDIHILTTISQDVDSIDALQEDSGEFLNDFYRNGSLQFHGMDVRISYFPMEIFHQINSSQIEKVGSLDIFLFHVFLYVS